jgi:ATP-dependent Clp protease adaptor protein ClpS
MTDQPSSTATIEENIAVEQTVSNQKSATARNKPDRKRQPQYNVVLWDDDDHSYDYVELMMRQLFGYSRSMSYSIARTVDSSGRAICLTTTREHAELKRDQIQAFGPDALIERCDGSMKASIEPVPGQ